MEDDKLYLEAASTHTLSLAGGLQYSRTGQKAGFDNRNSVLRYVEQPDIAAEIVSTKNLHRVVSASGKVMMSDADLRDHVSKQRG